MPGPHLYRIEPLGARLAGVDPATFDWFGHLPAVKQAFGCLAGLEAAPHILNADMQQQVCACTTAVLKSIHTLSQKMN